MPASICPTITAENPHLFRTQMERAAQFATRVHIDLSDGIFAPSRLVEIDKVWWPGGVRADIHAMLKQPFEYLDVYRALGPQLVIVHAEAQGDFAAFATYMHRHGIETGVALLQQTPVDRIAGALDMIDHVLVFSGDLGHFGGQVDMSLTQKVTQLKQLKPTLEIGWDGGVDDRNARVLADAGVDVLNVGGYIQRSEQPARAYQSLVRAVS